MQLIFLTGGGTASGFLFYRGGGDFQFCSGLNVFRRGDNHHDRPFTYDFDQFFQVGIEHADTAIGHSFRNRSRSIGAVYSDSIITRSFQPDKPGTVNPFHQPSVRGAVAPFAGIQNLLYFEHSFRGTLVADLGFIAFVLSAGYRIMAYAFAFVVEYI